MIPIKPRLFLPLSLLALLPSCGMTVMTPKQETLTNFSVKSDTWADGSKHRNLMKEKKGPNPTREQVLATWGEPPKKKLHGGQEIWIWRDKPEFVGGGLIVMLFPLPIGLPVAPVGEDIYFFPDSPRAIKAVSHDTDGHGFIIPEFHDC